MKKICQFISKYMGVLVFAAAVLAFVFPDTLSKIRPTVINYLLGVVMFGMGLTLNLQDFKIVFSRPKDIIIGCLASSLATLHFASYPLATTTQRGRLTMRHFVNWRGVMPVIFLNRRVKWWG